MNERITENYTRSELKRNGYKSEQIEEQQSTNQRVRMCLKRASKTGGIGIGRPEFIISHESEEDWKIVIECKSELKKHESVERNKPELYCVDGVIHYGLALSKEFNTITIAISGQEEEHMETSIFFIPKGTNEIIELESDIRSFDELIKLALYDPVFENIEYAKVLDFSKQLHIHMRDHAKISEEEKPLLVGGCLIALNDKAFEANYREFNQETDLNRELYSAIKRELDEAKLPAIKIQTVLYPFEFIKHHPELNKINKTGSSPTRTILDDINKKIKPFINTYQNIDVVGQFYGEFLRYSGADKKFGIVLTPKHITELFADIADITKNTIVLDIVAGTCGFLISSMVKMTKGMSSDDGNQIKRNNLIGVEQNPKMYALGVSNMILRGDGKTNLYQGDCFDQEIIKKIKNKANVGFQNPPYAQKGDNLQEFNFIENMLDNLTVGGLGIAIVPMSCSLNTKNQVRKGILKKHTLEAVMSMPDDLFYPVGVVPCIMVFKAHKSHNPNVETWFGYWKDDGFIKDKVKGRIDVGNWNDIKKGKRLIKKNREKGKTLYVSSSSQNNGVTDHIKNEPIHIANTITVTYDGSIGEAFYQSKEYYVSDDVNVLYPKYKLNEFIAMFLISLIRKEQYRYNYGRKWHLERMKKSKIKLPVDANGNPDWQYMEDYIKTLQYSKMLNGCE